MKFISKRLGIGICALMIGVSPISFPDFTVQKADAFELKRRGGGFKLFGNKKPRSYNTTKRTNSSDTSSSSQSYVKKSQSSKKAGDVWDQHGSSIRNAGSIPKKPVPTAFEKSNFSKQTFFSE